MKVLVYVEGPSDRMALEALLRRDIEAGRAKGIGISFHDLHNKDAVLKHGPARAAIHLKERPGDWVIALPDLHPMTKFTGTPPHKSFDELRAGLLNIFTKAADRQDVPKEARAHFLVHCLKHDLEVLLLAACDQLRKRLETKDKLGNWRNPVEDQDDVDPPKRVVEELFQKYKKRRYDGRVDAPWVLGHAEIATVETACPQRFAPFVADLRAIIAGRVPASCAPAMQEGQPT